MAGPQALTHLPPHGNWYRDDLALGHILSRYLSPEAISWAEPILSQMGQQAPEQLQELAELADRHPPVLHPRDKFGNRVDRIEFHPAYERLKEASYGGGIIGKYYHPMVRTTLGAGIEVVKFSHSYLFGQAEQGLYCPICMTDGSAFLIEQFGNDAQKKTFLPRLTSSNLDKLWEGAMFLTEKAGGSDVGANETTARPLADGRYELFGEKWFCSNAGAEVVMVLARLPEGAAGTRGLGLFVLRRHDDNGNLNKLHLERLKNKLGTRSMPTGEVILNGSVAELLGAPERGFVQMAEMLNLSRLYNATASLAVTRSVLREALRWCRARRTFGNTLTSYPLVRLALAEIACELEAAMHLVFDALARRGRVLCGEAIEEDGHLLRVVTPLAKYSTARLAVRSASEAVELLGGNGYIEDWPIARFYRDAQVLPVWEGTTNILTLDTLRALKKPNCAEAFFSFLDRSAQDERIKHALIELKNTVELVSNPPSPAHEALARSWCDRAVQIVQACLLSTASDDKRSAAVTDYYLLRHFSASRSPIEQPALLHAVEHFDAMLAY
jgi:alkylation response protein AidB-like acyl-CoA dehydrogenase